MLIVITGGAASGKSAQAERILCERAAPGSRLYLATMQPFGEAARARMLRHHKLRAGKGFETVERYTGLDSLKLERQYDGILLECMSNLLANEQFSPEGAGENAVACILQGIDSLRAQCRDLVIVTNEIFSDGEVYPEETMQYMRMLGQINCALAERADIVLYTVCGILLVQKGTIL